MTLGKEGLNFTVQCDNCLEAFDTETPEFQDAVTALKSVGWKVIKIHQEYEHLCPLCVAHETEDDFDACWEEKMGQEYRQRFECFKSKTIRDALIRFDDALVELEQKSGNEKTAREAIAAIKKVMET